MCAPVLTLKACMGMELQFLHSKPAWEWNSSSYTQSLHGNGTPVLITLKACMGMELQFLHSKPAWEWNYVCIFAYDVILCDTLKKSIRFCSVAES